jgi:hypothetical protein
MFNKIFDGFSKFFTKERVLILVIFLVLSWALISYSGAKGMVVDRMTNSNPIQSSSHQEDEDYKREEIRVQPSAPKQNSALQPVANPSDLLPVDPNSQWSALNPNTMNKGDVMLPDLLQAGYHIGLDTVGQSLRNANLQLRSDPIIQKADVGPWNMSTIEPDIGRVPLEIGVGPQ